MKKITTIIITAFAVFVLAGCSKNGENDDFMGGDLGPVVDNYVRGYIRPVKLFLPDKISDYQDEGSIYTQPVLFTPPPIMPFNDGEAWSRAKADKFEYENIIRSESQFEQNDDDFPIIPGLVNRYDSLCKAHKDMEYSKEIKHYAGHQFTWATYRRMTLDITSDTQYDAAHPAGTSLADMVIINISSAKEIIESGYDENLCGKEINIYGDEYPVLSFGYELRMPLKQFNEEYRKLVDCRMNIDFPVAPDVTSTHRFTVTYRDEDGRALTATAAPVTLQGKGAE